MGRLENTVAVITGSSSGIGECVARAMALEGSTVVICARGIAKAEVAADSINSAGGNAIAIACDVTSDDSVLALHDEVTRAVGQANVLVNSAGVYEISRFLDTSLDVYRNAIEVNYLGAVRMIKTFIPAMLDAGYGKVINIASTAGKYGSMYQAHYNGSKHAVVGMTRSLGVEYAKSGVCVNAICPGWAETPMLDEGIRQFAAATDMSFDDARKNWLSRIPMGRFLEPEELGPLAVYLASHECVGMVGQAMTISGGMVLV